MSDTDVTQARQDVAADVDEIIEHVINANMLSMPYDVYSELFDAVDGLGVEIENLQSENAKLRELVLDLYCLAYPSTVEWEVSDETYDKYSPCEKCQELHGGKSPCASTAKDMTEECCAPIQANVVADCLRELGVEVD